MTDRWDGRLLVVGAGLIGTSIGLAARAAGAAVELTDADPRQAQLAASLGAGDVRAADAGTSVDLALVAVPPRATGRVAVELLRTDMARTVSHVSSVQTLPQLEVEAAGRRVDRFVGGHPIAGRELSGPVHATADLFRDRPWVLCPTPASAADALDTVRDLARACGADPVVRDAAEHDRLLARISHAPQLVASALAASLLELGSDDAALAGSGMRDTTRLADSDPRLWQQIVAANAAPVAAALRGVTTPLLALASALEAGAGDEDLAALLNAGRQGRALLPGKHGRRPTALAVVHVVVPDEPGALAALLAAVAAEQINLEDLRVDHAPGQPVGVAELVVAPDQDERLLAALRGAGWTATGGASEAL